MIVWTPPTAENTMPPTKHTVVRIPHTAPPVVNVHRMPRSSAAPQCGATGSRQPRRPALVPIAMEGCAFGSSQRSTCTRSARGMLTQPFVDEPVCACRKIPEPRPGTTGCMLNSTTARYGYARGDFDMSGVGVLNGGRVPQGTYRKLL